MYNNTKSYRVTSPSDSDIYLSTSDSPVTTNFSHFSETSEVCLPLDSLLFEEDFDPISLLSPNSKASSLLSRSKRIEKRPIAKKEALPKSKPTAKKSASKGPQKRTAWTPEEDEQLLSLFKVYGAHWAQIASNIPNRTGKQVRDRYMAVLVANINRAPWTDEEDRMILVLVEKIGPQWSKIAENLKGRAEIQVKNRYYTYLKKYGIELSDEDRLNVNSGEATTETSPKGFDPTDMISYESENVNADFALLGQVCSPLDLRGSEEDVYEISPEPISLLSPNSMASALLPRSKRIYKKPFNFEETPKKSSSKGRQSRRLWTPSEDKKLLELFSEYGPSWAKIASEIPNRNGKQVRDRYLSALVSNIKRDPWSEEEDRVILEMFEKIGARWCEISDHLGGRSDIQVKNRYYTFLKKQGKRPKRKGRNGGNDAEEAPTEASPKGFDPADMISYDDEGKSMKDILREEEL